MRKLFLTCITTMFLSFSSVVWSDDLTDLKGLLDQVENLTGGFKQTITDKSGQLIQASEGSFSLKRPGYFYWHSEEPFQQTIIGSPDKLWVYDPDLEQVTIRKQNLNDSGSPVTILTGDMDSLKQNFKVAKTKNSTLMEFVLTPKAPDQANYQSVSVAFKDKSLRTIEFVDKLQQTTAVQFQDLKQNTQLDSTIFKFVPPPGTDIISDE